MRRWLVLAVLMLPLSAEAQEDDRDYLTAFLEDNLSGVGRKVTITGFEGALSSRATVERIAIADDGASGSPWMMWCWTGRDLRCWRAKWW